MGQEVCEEKPVAEKNQGLRDTVSGVTSFSDSKPQAREPDSAVPAARHTPGHTRLREQVWTQLCSVTLHQTETQDLFLSSSLMSSPRCPQADP